MRHLVFFNTAKTASVYLFNFFSSTVLRNRKSPVYSCAKEIVVLFNRETVLECKHLKEALYSLFNIFNKYNLAPIVVIAFHNNLYSKYTLHVVTCGYPPHARLVSNYFFFPFLLLPQMQCSCILKKKNVFHHGFRGVVIYSHCGAFVRPSMCPLCGVSYDGAHPSQFRIHGFFKGRKVRLKKYDIWASRDHRYANTIHGHGPERGKLS